MKDVQGPKVLYKIELLLIEIMKSVRNYPKVERYTLAERTEKTLLNGAENVFYASYNSALRLERLREARTQFQMVNFLLRVAKRQNFISEAFYAQTSGDLVEIGKMITGWIKTVELPRRKADGARL
jgi:hypothetical protein